MKSQKNTYSNAFKLRVIEEVLSGDLSKEQAQRKHGIRGKSAILNWMRKFGLSEQIRLPDNFERMKEEEEIDKESLNKRIKELERDLEDAKLKAEGYSRMIDIAERELKIKIRKKSSTKQSEK